MIKNNRLIKLSILFFFILNLLLIIIGLILQNIRIENIYKDINNDFTSNIMAKYISNGEDKTMDEVIKKIDYIDNDVRFVDSESYKYRKDISEKIFTFKISWVNLVDLLQHFGIDNVKFSLIANKKIIPLLILIDKWGDENSFIDVMKENGSLLSDFELSEKYNNISKWFNGLENESTLFYFLKIKIDLFIYNEKFYYDENNDGTFEYYDFSNGLTDENYFGNKEKNNIINDKIGIKNWDIQEITDFSNSLEFNCDIWNKNNKTFNLSIWQILNSFDDNTFSLFINYGKNCLKKYYLDNKIFYEDFEISNKKISPNKYFFKIKEHGLNIPFINSKKNYYFIDSIWEAIMYDIWKNIDYSKYFDNALILDKRESYNLKDIIYDFKMIDDSKIYTPEFNKLDNEVTENLWNKGDKTTTFSNFLILQKYYEPFFRSSNLKPFIFDFSKEISKNVKISDLEKPTKI